MPDRRYEVRVQGRLSQAAREAFPGMDVSVVPAETVISGPVRDDDELFALLALIQSLGLHVESLQQVSPLTPGRPAHLRRARRSARRDGTLPATGAATREPPATCHRGVETDMAIGPVQLIVLGFPDPDFHGEIIDELERLRASDTVRVIDALAVYKDPDGEVTAMHLSNLSEAEAIEVGSKVGALIGLGFDGEEGMDEGAAAGAQAAADGISAFSDEDAWDALDDIPNGSAAALILLEHHWAVGLRDAVARAGGFRVSDGFISPLDLIGIGLLSAEEAAQMHAMESTAVAT